MRVILSTFQGGEFSPLLESRYDLEALPRGCRRLRNAIPSNLGAAFQRPGFLRVGATRFADSPARLFPFSFSSDVNYRIELGEKYARFWRSTRLCITPEADDDDSTKFAPATLGTAQRYRWLAKSSVASLTKAFDYTHDHDHDELTQGATAPFGSTTAVVVSGGLKYKGKVYKGIVERMKCYFRPKFTGNYKFGVQGAKGPMRLRFATANNGQPKDALTLISVTGTPGSPVTVSTPGTYALTAGNAYFLEFVIAQTVNAPGQFVYSLNGGVFQQFTADRLARVKQITTPNAAGETGGVISKPGQPLLLATPWSANQVTELQMAQANDVVWLAHGSHLPRRLVRYGAEDWKIEKLPFVYPPLRDENSKLTTTLAASATSGQITVTAAGANVFDPGDVGGYYEIAHRREVPFVDMNLTANADSADIRIVGRWELYTTGKWTGTLKLFQRRKGTGQIDIIRTWKSANDYNANSSGELDGDQELFLRYTGTGTGEDSPRAVLSALDSTIRGLVQVTSFVNRRLVKAKVIRPLHSTAATIVWSEGAWSNRRGFPRAVTLHEQRLVFAGNKSEPQKVWCSGVDDFNNFERTTLEDSGFSYQIAAQQSNPIHSLVSQEGLLILTSGDEWVVNGGDSPVIMPSKINAKRRSGTGSEPIQPLLVGSTVLFVQQGERVLLEYLYDFQQAGFEAVDLTELAEHLGSEKLAQLAFAQNPFSVLWVVTKAGSLLSLTYKRKNGVVAWAKHVTPFGKFESVCCTPGANGINEVWVTVLRTINGVSSRSVEKLDIEHWDKIQEADGSALCVADAAVVQTFETPALEITGLDHLNGADVGVLADGAIQPDRRVVGGKITLDRPASKVVVGLIPTFELQPMGFEIQLDTGSTKGRRLRLSEMDVELYRTGACSYANDENAKEFPVAIRSVANPTGAAVPLFTGQRKLAVAGTHGQSTRVILRNQTMLPLNVLGLVLQVTVHGD